MNQYLVRYELPYVHTVTVGVSANSEVEACAIAREALESGSIWNDTPEMPLIEDRYEEAHIPDSALELEAVLAPKPIAEIRTESMELMIKEITNASPGDIDAPWTSEYA